MRLDLPSALPVSHHNFVFTLTSLAGNIRARFRVGEGLYGAAHKWKDGIEASNVKQRTTE